MPTRYQLDVELKSIVTADVISGSNPTARQNARKEVKKVFEDKWVLPIRASPLHTQALNLDGACQHLCMRLPQIWHVTEDGEEQVVLPETSILDLLWWPSSLKQFCKITCINLKRIPLSGCEGSIYSKYMKTFVPCDVFITSVSQARKKSFLLSSTSYRGDTYAISLIGTASPPYIWSLNVFHWPARLTTYL